MKDKKIYYLALMSGVLLGTFLVPLLIKAGSGLFISRFAPAAATKESETADEGYRVMEGFTEKDDIPAADAAVPHDDTDILMEEPEHDPDLVQRELQQRKEQTDKDLSAYLKKQDPKLSESRAGMIEVFASGRENALVKAVADHLYGTYGSLYEITAIDVVDFIDEDAYELTCQIKVTAVTGGKEYSEYYFATYNKVYDFYSIYAYHE